MGSREVNGPRILRRITTGSVTLCQERHARSRGFLRLVFIPHLYYIVVTGGDYAEPAHRERFKAMEHAIDSRDRPHPSTSLVLTSSRAEWPAEAKAAIRDVNRSLDAWCRTHDWPTATNSWIAEEAIRRGWEE